jgi:hypothetical protein
MGLSASRQDRSGTRCRHCRFGFQGESLIGDVLGRVRPPSTSVSVARASLSRTLRRLWAAGLVELFTGHATRPTLTEQATYKRRAYATVQASPETAYQAYRRQLATPADDLYRSAAAYVDAFRVDAERPSARVRRVALTPKGRATVNK